MSATHATQIDGRIILAPTGGFRERKATRKRTTMSAALRRRGFPIVDVRVLELSTHGFRASTEADIVQDTEIWLRLPGLEPLPAKVVWMMDCLMGGEFARPLHPAVLEMVLRKAD